LRPIPEKDPQCIMDELDGTSACKFIFWLKLLGRDWRHSEKHSPERVVEGRLGKILEEERCSADFSPIEPVRHVYPVIFDPVKMLA
jgi:hypothetical protein